MSESPLAKLQAEADACAASLKPGDEVREDAPGVYTFLRLLPAAIAKRGLRLVLVERAIRLEWGQKPGGALPSTDKGSLWRVELNPYLPNAEELYRVGERDGDKKKGRTP